MTKATSIIFDLDGTLADTLLVALDIANGMKVLPEPLTLADVERLKSMSIKSILRELNIPLRRLPSMLVKGRTALTKRMAEIPLCKDMDKALAALSAQGFDLYVMSSNSLENVNKFLKNHQVEKYFKDIQGGASVFGKAKPLKHLLKAQGIDKSQAYYVGDEVRDIEAAKKVGMGSVAVTWGFNSATLLQTYYPNGMAHTAEELVDFFKGVK